MKPVCHLLLLLLSFSLVACQSAPPEPKAPVAAANLNDLQTPSALGDWQLQGSIGQDDKMHVARYQLTTDAKQIMDISLYPLPDGWQQFTSAEALQRQFSMLAHQIAANASDRYQARQVEVSNGQVIAATANQPALINSRFTSHFADGSTRVTLVSLSIYKGNFVRLTLTCPSAKADPLTTSLQAARASLIQHFDKITGAAGNHG